MRVPGNRDSHPASIHPYYADLTRCTEHLLRSISNLHERLHHSIAQYTMPSPSKFVSHGEYIYPAILVSLPMVVRAATLALRDLKTCPVDGPQFAPIRLRLPLDDGQELFDTGGESVDRVVQCGPIRSRARGGLVLFLSLNMSTMSPEYIIDEGRFL